MAAVVTNVNQIYIPVLITCKLNLHAYHSCYHIENKIKITNDITTVNISASLAVVSN